MLFRSRPYHYDVSGRQGVAAYLKTLYLTIAEDELDLMYEDEPDLSADLGQFVDEALAATGGHDPHAAQGKPYPSEEELSLF